MAALKRQKVVYLRMALSGKRFNVRTPVKSKKEALRMEALIKTAHTTGDCSILDANSLEVYIRICTNQGWEIPSGLAPLEPVRKELTLWEAVPIFRNYPTVRGCKSEQRYMYCLIPLVRFYGKEFPVKSIKVPNIREYQAERLRQGASPATVNWEKSTLSKLLGVLVEMELLDSNPARSVKRLSVKSGEREVYLSRSDFLEIVGQCARWYVLFLMTLYYTGMRRSEAAGLTRSQINLERRIIYLGPEDTKEGRRKRIPIHRDLVPWLEESLKVRAIDSDRVFLISDRKGCRPPSMESFKNPWAKAVRRLGMDPKPRLHDLRHTWRTNARRSGMDPQIAESIMGHWYKEKSVNDRYGRISDAELLKAIDNMTFDHGETEIWVGGTGS